MSSGKMAGIAGKFKDDCVDLDNGLTYLESGQCFCSSNDRHFDPDHFPSQETRLPAIIQETIQEFAKFHGSQEETSKPHIDPRT